MPLGMATMEELRDALVKFKERSGKFVVAYSDFYTQGTYYLSSVADRLYLNPQGTLLWKGLSSNVMFYKGLLDKLGVRPEVIRHGAYKAAVEPFIMDRMSPENRRQTEELIGTIWSHVVGGIARARSLDSAALQQYASTLAIGDAALAVEKKMVDSLAYSADMEAMLAGMTGQQETRFISLEDYVMQGQVGSSGGKGSGNRIAVLYVEGDIVDGEAPEREVGGETLAAKLADLRRDEEVKAVVLRVNSPGGSVTDGMAIYDTMQFIKCDVSTICVGMAASMGAFLLSSGTKGKRLALPNAEIMIHQPSGGTQGQATDMQIQVERMLKIKQRLNEILAANTGKPLETIKIDTERDNFMTAEEAQAYGLVDKVIYKRQ